MPTLSIDVAARLATFQDSLDKIGRQGEQLTGRLNKAFGTVKSSIAALGAGLAAGGFALFVKSGIDAADNLNKLSQRVGVSVESLSALQYASQLSAVSADQLTDGLTKLAKAAGDTAAGTGEARGAFEALGISIKNSGGQVKGTEALLLEIADKFAGIEDGTGKAALAMKLFGESGTRLIPFLNQGRAGIEGLKNEAERLGVVLSSETAKAAEEFNDNMTRLGTQTERLKIALVENLIPALSRVAEEMVRAVREGDGFLGLLKALTNLSPFNDLQRASKELVELVDEQFSIEQEIAKRAGKAGQAELTALNERLAATKTRVGEVQKLLGVLRGETNALGEPINPQDTKKAPAPDIANPADALAAIRAKAQSESKKIADALKAEEAAISGSIDILGTMLQQNLISFETYYAERSRLQKEGLDATIAAAQEEIRVAQRLRSQLPKEADRTAQDDKIRDAQSRIEEAQKAFARTTVQSFYEADRAAQAYVQKLADIAIQIKEIDGDVVGAALGRFGQATRDLQLQAQAKGDTAALGNIDALRQRVAAQAQVNSLLQQAQIIQEQLSNAEARVQNERNLGALSELDGLRKTSTARQEALAQLERIAKAYSDIAAASNNPVLKQQAENFKRQVEDLAASADLVKQKFQQIGESGLSQFFEDILDGTKSVKEAFADMGRSILQEVNKLVAQDIAKKIFGSFGGGSSGGGGGGFLEIAGSFLGSLFGGARADGGPVEAGRGYVVGERGPEWFMPRQSGQIIPAGAGGTVINYSPTFQIRGDMNTPQSRSQLAASALRGLDYGRRNQ